MKIISHFQKFSFWEKFSRKSEWIFSGQSESASFFQDSQELAVGGSGILVRENNTQKEKFNRKDHQIPPLPILTIYAGNYDFQKSPLGQYGPWPLPAPATGLNKFLCSIKEDCSHCREKNFPNNITPTFGSKNC